MSERTRILALVVGLGLIGAAVAGRFLALEADPTNPFWSGWVGDEGRWTGTAREWVLFRDLGFQSPLARTHLVLAPLYQAAVAAVFMLVGPGLGTARAVSALAGLALVGLVFVGTRRSLGRAGVLAATAGVALHPELVYYSRVAIPEIPALVWQAGAFFTLVGWRERRWASVLSGALFAVACGFKGTVLPVLPAFVIVAAVTAPSGRRLGAAAGFLGTVTLAAAAAGAVAVGLLGTGSVVTGEGGFAQILDFLSPDTPYGMLSTLHEGGHTLGVNLLLAAVWAPTILLLWRAPETTPDRIVLAGAAVWAAGWLAVWFSLEYFAARYLVHLYLPLILMLAAIVSIVQREGLEASALLRLRGPGRAAAFMILALPLGFALAPAVLNVAALVSPPLVRMREHYLVGLGLAVVLGGVLHRRGPPSALPTMVLGPPLLALTWIVAWELGWISPAFWLVDGLEGVARWATLGAAAALLGVGCAAVVRRWNASLPIPLTLALATVWAVSSVASLDPTLTSVRDAARYIDDRYPEGAEVGVLMAGGVLLDTRLRGLELEPPWRDRFPDRMVVHWGARIPPDAMEGFRLVREFPVSLGRNFEYLHEFDEPPAIRVYERGLVSSGSP